MAVTQATGSYRQLIVSMVSLLKEQKVLQIRGILAFLMFAAFNIFWSALVIPLSAAPYFFSHTAIGAFGLAGAIGAIAAGSGFGAISATMMYAYAGWNGVCLLGASVSLLALLFWRATLNIAG
ncbi:MAG: MFS transporter, partial [Morganella morganii]